MEWDGITNTRSAPLINNCPRQFSIQKNLRVSKFNPPDIDLNSLNLHLKFWNKNPKILWNFINGISEARPDHLILPSGPQNRSGWKGIIQDSSATIQRPVFKSIQFAKFLPKLS